jgi:hypothetical protein
LQIISHPAIFGTGGLQMSRAFMKESDDQWLHDVAPTVNALLIYLTRENNGIRVYEEKRILDAMDGKCMQ